MDMNPVGIVLADSNLLKKLPASWGIEALRCIKDKPEQQLYECANGLGQRFMIRVQIYQPERERVWHTLSHYTLPHLGAVLACCHLDGYLCILERYYKGETLHQAVSEGRRVGKRQILKAMLNINQDLATLYSQAGLLHLDIKPDNFLIDAYGNVTLIDFGAAYSDIQNLDFTKLFQYGTPVYAAPERLTSPNLVGPPADLYSLMAVLKWWLSAEGLLDYGLWEAIEKWQQQRITYVEALSFNASAPSAGAEAYGGFEHLLFQGIQNS